MTVTLERADDGRVATLRFAGEHPANALDLATVEALLTRVDEARADRDLRVLVVAGRDDVFSAGADLKHLAGLADDDYRHYIATEYRLFAAVESLPLITVAAVAGACVGNAAELALACDFRIVATAGRIGLPEMRIGFVAPAQRLAAYVGVGKARELLYAGRLLPADEAFALGLVTEVADDLPAAVERAAQRWSAVAPFALPYTKAGLARVYGLATPTGGRFDEQEAAAAFATFRGPDFAEGSAAALAGRRPDFTSRRGQDW